MCQICYNENLEVLEGILIIEDCKNISTVPIIEGLQRISIRDCDNIMTIPIIEGLHTLTIVNCNNITTIPIIEGLQALTIYNCNNITTIPTIKGLQELSVIRCKKISEKYYTKNNLNYIYYHNNDDAKCFYSINKIKKWYKRRALYNKYKLCIHQMEELVIMDQMNPHKKDNIYLQNIVNEFSYE